jgi:hypothetical protein
LPNRWGNDEELAWTIAMCIPSVRVVKVNRFYFAVARKHARISMEKWWVNYIQVPKDNVSEPRVSRSSGQVVELDSFR